jgi:hypothetical protein
MTLACLVASPWAFAGRPLSTEDASVLESGRCQLESWVDRSRDSSTGWLVPACNLGLGIEWQAGSARLREGGQGRSSESYFQAKRVLVEPADAALGIGVVIGVGRRVLNERHRGWQNPYVTVPFTRPFGDAVLHANIGWSRDKEASRDMATWGLAAERPQGRWTLLGEVFGANSDPPYWRLGGRWSAVPEVLDIDLTWIRRRGGEASDRAVSIGFTVVSPPFSR